MKLLDILKETRINIAKIQTAKDNPPFKIVNEAIPLGFAGFKGYFDGIERNMAGVERTLKALAKDLGKEGYKKESIELQKIFKKYFVELNVQYQNFKRKNT